MIVNQPTPSMDTGKKLVTPARASEKLIVNAATGSTSAGPSRGSLYWQTSQVDMKSIPLAFSKLSARERLKKLAKTDPFGFAASILGVPLALYLIARALDETLNIFSMTARADTPATASNFVSGSVRDAFDWYVGALMGVVLIISICATFYANDNKKIEFGKDMTKTIVGFLVGFLGGGKITAK